LATGGGIGALKCRHGEDLLVNKTDPEYVVAEKGVDPDVPLQGIEGFRVIQVPSKLEALVDSLYYLRIEEQLDEVKPLRCGGPAKYGEKLIDIWLHGCRKHIEYLTSRGNVCVGQLG
jgi:hypothetical protein